ncbi:MAG: Glycosyl transferase family 2 [Candidatus Roizmanbacteria bacterium GW2011_GWA2_37_7]|uniref:Glycosyl transferase family 2 n=1 Tax=Candidatus Roizmanbacteria bacterium GW2011_GWA2_37_7 TaxID=1618481 RepID=A0A0G0JNY0_9BACT|nr:MAG: Glycosyl transferase family 2 [Candidatus Roizmanbacteria bacterium GW2011_GWA2_37_7]
MTISVLIPVYKGSQILEAALESVLNQTEKPDEVIIGNDTPADNTQENKKIAALIDAFEKKAKFPVTSITNKHNLGCQKNFQKITDTASKDIVLYLAHDDILSINAVSIVKNVFQNNPKVGFATRPYFWFFDDVQKPIRHVPPPNINQHTLIPSANQLIKPTHTFNITNTIQDIDSAVHAIFGSIGQISGLALRRKWIQKPFHIDIFPGHIYPIADIWKQHQGIFIKNYIVAIGTATSQSRTVTGMYDDSPTEQWIRMFRHHFQDKRYQQILKSCTKHIATNYIGLIQIKNYSSMSHVFREICTLMKFRKRNIFELQFWMYSLLAIVIPKKFLRFLTDWYKQNILSITVPEIRFK